MIALLLTQELIGKGDAQWDGQVKYINGMTVSGALWNFAYELNDADVLREEHILEAKYWERQDARTDDFLMTGET